MSEATLNCPEVGQIIRVTTDYSAYLAGHVSTVGRGTIYVGVVTHVCEDGLGFEMTTGRTSGFMLREILMKNATSVEVLEGSYSLGGHLAGVADADSRVKEAERKKTTREKREAMYL